MPLKDVANGNKTFVLPSGVTLIYKEFPFWVGNPRASQSPNVLLVHFLSSLSDDQYQVLVHKGTLVPAQLAPDAFADLRFLLSKGQPTNGGKPSREVLKQLLDSPNTQLSMKLLPQVSFESEGNVVGTISFPRPNTPRYSAFTDVKTTPVPDPKVGPSLIEPFIDEGVNEFQELPVSIDKEAWKFSEIGPLLSRVMGDNFKIEPSLEQGALYLTPGQWSVGELVKGMSIAFGVEVRRTDDTYLLAPSGAHKQISAIVMDARASAEADPKIDTFFSQRYEADNNGVLVSPFASAQFATPTYQSATTLSEKQRQFVSEQTGGQQIGRFKCFSNCGIYLKNPNIETQWGFNYVAITEAPGTEFVPSPQFALPVQLFADRYKAKVTP